MAKQKQNGDAARSSPTAEGGQEGLDFATPVSAGREASDPGESSRGGFAVVGIGASAGGLDAFKRFFEQMPANSGIAFVLVQHLDPDHESLAVELIGRHTAMPVLAAADQMPVEPDHVYVIPPNKYLTLSGRKLHLSEPIKQRGVRVPIDFFFRSLAEEQQQRAICVVLSGTGSDGTLGLREVKAAGGLAMVQAPETAQFDGMPRSAIATGVVDYVLPIEQMPAVLTRYVRHPYVNGGPGAQAAPDGDPLNTIVGLLRSQLKYDFSGYKQGTLRRRIRRRMGLRQIENTTEYVEFLREHGEEVAALGKDLLISVTNFFREPAAWQLLEEQVIVPLVRSHRPDAPIRVWVPGCATGEEPYSIAMLLVEQLRATGKSCGIQLFASDIDQDALNVARAGVYPETIAADVPAGRLEQFFNKGEHTFRINQDIRESVIFAEQNLISDPPFSKLDLISCRNLLIYLEGEVQRRVLSLFHFALNPSGYLFLGNSETIADQRDLYEPVSKKWRIYRRIGPSRNDKLEFPLGRGGGLRPTPESPATPDRQGRLGAVAQQFMLQRFCPASVLINRKAEALYLHGATDRYLQLPAGELGADLSAMAREGLRTKLRAAVRQAIRGDQEVQISDARVKRGKSYFPVRITIEPIRSPTAAEGLLLVAFSEAAEGDAAADGRQSAAGPAAEVARGASDSEELVRQLEDELRQTRDELQSTIEELETGSEEFKAANEEVVSINEELQSTNEELETSKEELQSLNEELTTVNQQLEQKIAELEVATNDLTNLLASSDIAAVFLDRQFRVKRFTPATTRLLNLIPADIGRPVGDLTPKFAEGDLVADARQVLEQLVPVVSEVRTFDGEWYIRRLLPYRTEDNRIDGVVITFTDITERKASERDIHAARRYAEGIVETVRNPLVVLGPDLRVKSCNHAFYEMFRLAPAEAEGRPIHELNDGQWDMPALRTLLQEVLPRGGPAESSGTPDPRAVVDYELEFSLPGIGARTMLLNARAIVIDEGTADLILLAVEDITERRRAAAELLKLNQSLEQRVAQRARSHARLASLVASSKDAVVALDFDGTITDWNKGAESLFGHAEQEAVGRDIDGLVFPERPSPCREVVRRLRAGETVSSFETVGQAKNGQSKDLSLTMSLIQTPDGQVTGVSGILRDISDRKRWEQRLAELAEQERRRIGHELHDSLGQQISALGILATSLQQTLEDRSSPELGRASQLVRGIEDAKSQVRSLSQGLLPVEVDAEGLMSALRELTARSERLFGLACVFECPRPVRVNDNTTATHLYRIAQEAVSNAGRHARASEIIVSLREDNEITLQIRDDGAGLPDPLPAQESGLRIMRHRADLIRAALTIAAGPNGGTVVTCSIPGRRDSDGQAQCD